jgi:hypothetical protein
MSKDASTFLVGALLMYLTGYELFRTYLTNTTYNVMKRASPRVPRGTDPGLFWFNVVFEACSFLLSVYLVITSGIALA